MRVLVVKPEHRPEVREIEGSLKSMQEIVGGLIQPVYPFWCSSAPANYYFTEAEYEGQGIHS